MKRPVLLTLRALGLGDLLTAVPALRALADAFPDHRRVLATTSGVAPLALHIGAVDEVVAAEPLGPVRVPLGPVDVAVNLHGKGPQSHEVLWALSPRLLIAFDSTGSAASASSGPAWRADEHEVVRWCRLLEESGIPADPTRLDIEAPAGRAVPAVAVGATVIHPGAADPARRWPAERWAAVARALDGPVVVTGGRSEVDMARAVAADAGLPPAAVLAGTTDVVALAAVVGAARRVVCGDTGVAHLATALRRPSVVLFGPVPPAEWGPPPDRPWHTALWTGRRGDPHGVEPFEGLLEITVDDVLAALAALPDVGDVPGAPELQRL